MPISYKNKIYTTLGTPTESSGNVVSTTDSAGVPAKDYTVKGKTIVWNQLLDKSKYAATKTIAGVTFTNNGDGTIIANGTATANAVFAPIGLSNPTPIVSGHKFLFISCPSGGSLNTYYSDLKDVPGDHSFYDVGSGVIMTAASTVTGLRYNIRVMSGYTANNLVFKPQLFDLTQMFGASNEPSTPEEFRAMFPDDYYPYNAGELKTIVPTSVEAKNQSGETRSVNIPSSEYFPDGMKSAGSAYDEINFLSQKAIKRIGAVDMGTLNWDSNTGTYPSNSFYSSTLADTKGSTTNVISNGKFYNLYINENGRIIALTASDEKYDSSEAFKAAMSGVMLYYELATPVETPITPPLQALPTYKGFTSFSAPNSLTQNGPLSVTYYAEGGANPEKGWLTSYKRKLYMGRNIEWNQLFTNSQTSSNGVTISNNQDGTMTLNGTANKSYINFTNLSDAMNQVHKYLLCLKILNNPDNVSFSYGWFNRSGMRTDIISNGESCTICDQTEPKTQEGKSNGLTNFAAGTVFNNVKIAVMVMDLTQMFGAGNEPATSEEFWSYFDHNLYPYNPGETQPLFKISRKSQWGSATATALYVGENIVIPQTVRN